MPPLELIALRANAPQFDPAKGAAGLPARILVLDWGDHATTKGQVVCNATTMQELPAYNAAQNWDRIALDFEHNSVPGSPTYAGEPVKISGYGTLQLVAGEGIYLCMTSWTAEGRSFAAGGHYGDLSPVVKVNARNEVIGLHSVALCRHGATPGLVFLSAAPAVQHEASSQDNSASPMDPKAFQSALAKALGLPDTATAEEILSGLTSKLGASVEAEKQLSTLKLEHDKLKTLSATAKVEGDPDLKALSAQLKEQGDTLKALSTQYENSERGSVIAAAIRDGKQVPDMAKTMNLADLKTLCAQLPVTVPMDKRTPNLEALMLTTTPATSAAVEAVSELTGVTADMRAKHAKR